MPRLTKLRALCLLAAAGALVFLPGLLAPRFLDDYVHTAMIRGTFPAPRGPFDLYEFVNDANRSDFVRRGLMPWWTHPQMSLRFFRPLPSALLWFEQRALGLSVVAEHLHSFLWWVAAVAAVGGLLHRLLPRRPAFLATAIFAFAPCHALPLAWLANREALLSLALGAFALHLYVVFREDRKPLAALGAGLVFAVALLAGEYTLCFCGYVAAYELLRKGDRPRVRLASMLVFAVPTAAYLAAHQLLHYGAYGSGYYASPFQEPGSFLAEAPLRFAVLLAEGWLSVIDDTWGGAEYRWLAVLLALGGSYVVVRLFQRARGRLAATPRRHAAWLALGSLFALVPVLAVIPSARLLGVSVIGIAATVAVLVNDAWFPEERAGGAAPSPVMNAAELLVLGLAFAHFVRGPVLSVLDTARIRRLAINFAADAATMKDALAKHPEPSVVVTLGDVDCLFGPFAVLVLGGPLVPWQLLTDPDAGHVLAMRRGEGDLELTVPRTTAVFPVLRPGLFRSPEAMVPVGAHFEVDGFTIDTLAEGALGPTKVRAHFSDEAKLRGALWFVRSGGRLAEVTLPEVGFGRPFDR